MARNLPRRRKMLWRYLLLLVPMALGPVALVVYAMSMFGAAFWLMSSTALPPEDWTSVDGVVESVEPGSLVGAGEADGAGPYEFVVDPAGDGCVVSYSYVVADGSAHDGREAWPYVDDDWCRAAVGAPIDVAYDADEVTSSVLDTRDQFESFGNRLRLVYVGIGALAAVALAGAVAVIVGHVGNRRFRKAVEGQGVGPASS